MRTQSYDEDDEPIYLEDAKPFEVTPEIVRRFGQGFTKKQYRAMQGKYDFLTVSYPDVTNLHPEALCTYIKLKVQEEQAVVEGDVEKAAEWSALASKAADKAKIKMCIRDRLGGQQRRHSCGGRAVHGDGYRRRKVWRRRNDL